MQKSRRLLAVVALSLLLLLSFVFLPFGDSKTQPDQATEVPVPSAELISRGEYLATAGNCASCHTIGSGELMAGGLPFETPFGTLFSTNISPDKETGIGDWTEQDFRNSMRHGIRPNGEHLYPAFPYTAFTKTSNQDISAIFAYLKTLPAVPQTSFENALSFPFNQRPLMGIWKALFFEAGSFQPDASQSQQWNRGAYLVEALGHCSACHSPRNFLGAEKASLAMAGGEYVDLVHEDEKRPWSAPNLTATERGLNLWSQSDLQDYLKTARNDFIESFGPMNEVIINSTSQLSDLDIEAMSLYLKSLAPVEEATGDVPTALTMGRGRTVYNLHCGTCHLPTGEGDPLMAPRLNSGSLVVQSENPASMINAILYSPKTPGPPLLPKWRHPMEEFQYLLDDNEIAAVATFVRNSWENSAGSVTPAQVARQR